MQHLYFHSSLLIGDLIYALPGIRQVCKAYAKLYPEQFSGRAVIYLGLNKQWPMAPEIMRRGGITMTKNDLEFLRPLLLRQDYIEDVLEHEEGKGVNVNLDKIMGIYGDSINIPYGCLPRWYFQVWPEMTCDLSKTWITVDERVKLFSKKMILISRSARSHNPNIDYKFLEKYSDRLLFIGLPDEHQDFRRCFFDMPHYEVKTALELAIAIASCKFMIANQSFPYAIAEAMKVPRVLELFKPMPHIIPVGEHAYDFYFTEAFESIVEKLIALP